MTDEWLLYLRIFVLTALGIIIISFLITKFFLFFIGGKDVAAPPKDISAKTFVYSFNAPGVLYEAARVADSSSPYWFLDSGSALIIGNGIGQTAQGELSAKDPWRIAYSRSNPIDTDNGFHPQNIFRLFTKGRWEDFSEQMLFYIAKDNFSASPNRNASNGLLLMSRHTGDGDTLYYAGIRVDGTAILKKKYQGMYYTMAQGKVFPGVYTKNGTVSSRNLLPHNQWLALQLKTITNVDDSVTLTLSLKREGEAGWTQLLSATDSGRYGGTPPITGANYAGIRTDFMDVGFADFRIDAAP